MSRPHSENNSDWALWLGAGFLAIAAHAAGANYARLQIPPDLPEPEPTQIVVEMLEFANSNVGPAQTPETVSAAQATTAANTPETLGRIEPADTASAVQPEIETVEGKAPNAATEATSQETLGSVPQNAARVASEKVQPAPEVAPSAPKAASSAPAPERVTGQSAAPEAPAQNQAPAPQAAPARVAASTLVANTAVKGTEVTADRPSTVAVAPETSQTQAPRIIAGQTVGSETATAAVPTLGATEAIPAAPTVETVVSTPQAIAPVTEEDSTDTAADTPKPAPKIDIPEGMVAERLTPLGEETPDPPDQEEQAAEQTDASPPEPENKIEIPEGMVAERLSPRTETIEGSQATEDVVASLDVPEESPPEAIEIPEGMVAERLAPTNPSSEGDTASAPAPSGEITDDDRRRYQAILDYLKTYDGGSCFAALPALGEETATLTLDAFAETDKRLDTFRDGLETRAGITPGTYLKPVSAAQCATLSFIKNVPSYPGFQVYFDLAEREIESGKFLRGRIHNTGGRVLHLLLIDDEGTVQTLDSFLKFTAGAAIFEIPMSFEGDAPIVTQQLLLAVAAPARLETVTAENGTDAALFFTNLQLELLRKSAALDLAMIAFSVK